MSKISGDINREMMGYAKEHTGDCYGDGTIFGGVRSTDPSVKTTYTMYDLAYAKGVPSVVSNAIIAISEDCVKANEKLHALKEASKLLLDDLETYHNQYPHMAKGYVLDKVELLKNVLKEVEE